MKKISCKLLHRLLCAGLVLTLALFHPAVISTAAAAGEKSLYAFAFWS